MEMFHDRNGVEMFIFSVLLQLLITSDWANQQINRISHRFDNSSCILGDHVSEKETLILH